jgi:hypothetical protein
VIGDPMNLLPSQRPARVRPEPPLPATIGLRPGADPDGHLATGWEPHRPLSDGLIRRFVYAYATSFVSPVALMGGHVVHRESYVTWDRGAPAGLYNGAMLLQPLPHTGWERTVDELEADLLPTGTGEVILFSPWPTPDLTDRGWRLSGHPPMLLRPSGEPEPPVPDWLQIREVGDARTLADWEQVAIDGYPLDELRAAGPGSFVDERILCDPRLHAWVAYDDGDAFAIGTSYVVHGLHVPTLGVTLPAHRGRGAWHVLMRRRLSTFSSLPAMALFSDLSRRPAEGLGFLPLTRWTVWLRDRTGATPDPQRTENGRQPTTAAVQRPYLPP